MSTMRQFYVDGGVPYEVPGTPGDVLGPWLEHRRRFHAYLAGLDDEAMAGPTRCTEWTVTEVTKHLLSVTTFFHHTIARARAGEATMLLRGFDPAVTPSAAMGAMAGMGPDEARAAFAQTDERLTRELEQLDDEAWLALAEIPAGWVPVRASLRHAFWDSWLHERDVMVPRDEQPPAEIAEVEIVARYALLLAGAAAAGLRDGSQDRVRAVNVELRDPLISCTIDTTGPRVQLADADGSLPSVRGAAVDVIDLGAGRTPGGEVSGDADALGFLGRFLEILAG